MKTLKDSQGQRLKRFNRAMAAAMPASDAGMRRMVTDNSVMSFTPGEIADARCDALLAMIEEERGARKQEVQEIHKMLLEVFAKLQNSTASDNRKSIFVHDKEQVCKEAESSMCEHGDLDNRFAELESLCKSLKSELEHFVKCEAEERFHQLDRMLAEWRQDQQTSKMEGRTSGEKLEDQMRHLSPGRVSSPQVASRGVRVVKHPASPGAVSAGSQVDSRCDSVLPRRFLLNRTTPALPVGVGITPTQLQGKVVSGPPAFPLARPVSPIAVAPAGAPGYIGQAPAGMAVRR